MAAADHLHPMPSDPRCHAGSVKTLWKRINDGWPAERAITTEVRR
jgi:hypothetical protein